MRGPISKWEVAVFGTVASLAFVGSVGAIGVKLAGKKHHEVMSEQRPEDQWHANELIVNLDRKQDTRFTFECAGKMLHATISGNKSAELDWPHDPACTDETLTANDDIGSALAQTAIASYQR